MGESRHRHYKKRSKDKRKLKIHRKLAIKWKVYLQQLSNDVKRMLERKPFVGTMAIATMFALFGNDILFASCPKAFDGIFNFFILVTFILFVIELTLFSLVVPGYFHTPRLGNGCREISPWHSAQWYQNIMFGSFYFWLDLIALISLIPEVSELSLIDDALHFIFICT